MRWLTAWDTESPQPRASTLNDYAGVITSNSAVVPAGTTGAINIFVKDATDVIIDINGYYQEVGDSNFNTTLGMVALASGGGFSNTAVGYAALTSDTSGRENTAIGAHALVFNGEGGMNVAVGDLALGNNTGGYFNTAVGYQALLNNLIGSWNLGIGQFAGANPVSGSHNIFIGNVGEQLDNQVIRIGDSNQTATYISGIYGAGVSGTPVVVSSAGQLGVASSSRVFKQDIADMGDTTKTIMSLHPVRFHYKADGPDSPMQYGLIAEDVAEVAPDLVARNKDGEIETVYYDKVNAMLLNEVQKLHREKDALADTVRRLESRLAVVERTAR